MFDMQLLANFTLENSRNPNFGQLRENPQQKNMQN
jgi:hypothetical protein